MSYVSSFNSRLIARQLHGKLTMAKQLEGHRPPPFWAQWGVARTHTDRQTHAYAKTASQE